MSSRPIPELAVSLLRAVKTGNKTTGLEREIASLDRERLIDTLDDDASRKAV